MKIDPNKLLISETFYSIQGEGKTTGVPSVFIRLTHCNLSCGFSQKYVNDYRRGKIPEVTAGTIKGDLHGQGVANWTCDSMPVWIRGREWEFQELIDKWKEEGIYADICKGLIHLIWTGGEPTIPGHQDSISNFNKYWEETEQNEHGESWLHATVFQEIETNGTIYIYPDLSMFLNQINCSAKLSNSGMAENQRINPKAIQRIMEHNNYQFKFVVSNEDDIEEMFVDYINPHKIPLENVCCMPGMDKQSEYFERTRWIMEMAKKYKFRATTRQHIAAWNQATGV